MIFTDRKITIRNSKSSIDEPVVLYRGDYEVSIRFTIMEFKFRFKSDVNLVDSEKASFGQLVILAPHGGNVFSDVVECEDGIVTFTLTKEMIDQLEEVGLYSFQIRLFDYDKESRVSIPPVEFGIEVREPVASEDHDNNVNIAMVGYSIAKVVDGINEDVGPTFDANGQYNKTDWETSVRISEEKLNKIEDAIDKINQNEINDKNSLNKQMTSNFNVLQNQIDNLVIECENTDAEVEQARGEYNLLDQRLNAMEEKFKNDVDDVNSEVSNIEKEIKDINDQVSIQETKMLQKEIKNKLSYKKIAYELPLIFPDYDYILIFNNCKYIYPQSFAIDGDNIYILYTPDESTTKSNRWIAMYNKNSEYLGCFSAGLSGGEGLEIIMEGNKKYLYAKGEGSQLNKYDISVIPSNRAVLSPIDTFSVGLYYDFSYYKGTWLIEQNGASLGAKISRNVFGMFDDNFNSLGYITINLKDTGLWQSSDAYYSKIPKRQGVSLCGNVIYQATGGYWGTELGVPDPVSYQGIKVFNLDGNLKEETLLDPSKMRDKLISVGVNCTRIEHEGVKFFDDKLYSIVITLGRGDTLASTEGILIFEEMNEEGINFDDCKVTYTAIDSTRLQIGMYPRAGDGGLYDFITGEKLTSIDRIIRYMREIGLMNFSFYSSAVSIIDLNGTTIPSGILVTIKNVNNTGFFMDYQGDNGNVKKFILYQVDEAYMQKEISMYTTHELTLLNDASLFYDNKPVTVKSDGHVVTISGYITNAATGTIIGNLPEQYRPRHNIPFIVALSGSTNGGYGVIFIKTTGDIEIIYRSSSDVKYIAITANYTI